MGSSWGGGPFGVRVSSGWGPSLGGCHLMVGALLRWGSSWGGGPLEVGVWGPGKPGQHQIWPPRAGEERARPWCAPAMGREFGAESPDILGPSILSQEKAHTNFSVKYPPLSLETPEFISRMLQTCGLEILQVSGKTLLVFFSKLFLTCPEGWSGFSVSQWFSSSFLEKHPVLTLAPLST